MAEELALVGPLDTAGAAPGRVDVAVLVLDVEGAWSEPAGRAVVLDTGTEGAALTTEPAASLLIGSLVVDLGSCMTLCEALLGSGIAPADREIRLKEGGMRLVLDLAAVAWVTGGIDLLVGDRSGIKAAIALSVCDLAIVEGLVGELRGIGSGLASERLFDRLLDVLDW